MRFKDDIHGQCKVRLVIDLDLRDSHDRLYTWRERGIFRHFIKPVVVKELILLFKICNYGKIYKI